MRVLIIGGSGFIGPFVVRELLRGGHTVGVFHRGHAANLPSEIEHIAGDRKNLQQHRNQLRRFAPEVVVDLILSSGAQAKALMDVCREATGRVVAASSADVYQACNVLQGVDPGPIEPVPLTEDSHLRSTLHPYPPEMLHEMQKTVGWLDQEYDKIPVEREIMSHADLAGTVLRLPMVYGPGDRNRRLFPIVKRMDDRRASILFPDDVAAWRSPRGYVENVAAAIALAATAEKAAGRIYNVAETPAFSELEWAKKVAEQAGWRGDFVILPRERAPKHLQLPGNFAQHLETSSERIRRELGFREPVPPEEAIRRTIAWERANPPDQIDPAQFDYAAEDAILAA